MTDKKRKKALGRGLSSLLDDVARPQKPATGQERSIPIDLIRPNPDQPRRAFPPKELEELASSIRSNGILQPLLLRPDPNEPGCFQIVAGERRWRAAQAASLHEAPAVVRELTDVQVLEAAIIENVQRADLNPIEEASGYAQLIERFGHSQTKLAESMGKSRSHIANTLRLLNLPEAVRDHVSAGRLSAGHARALVTAENPAALARDIIAKGLSVRQTEDLARKVVTRSTGTKRKTKKDADTRTLEADLSAAIGLNVQINHSPKGGTVQVAYKTLEELDGLCQLLNR